jgi:predicted permease
LRAGERGSSQASHKIYRVLVMGEVALACTLLVSSGLLVRTVGRMTDVPTGVGSPEVVTASVQLSSGGRPRQTTADWEPVATSHGAILDLVRQQPGVRAAGAANFLPFEAGWRVSFQIEGQPLVSQNDAPQAQYHTVSDGYFEAIGATRASGRFFTPQDTSTTTPVAVVNKAFARQFFPAVDPVGRIILSTARAIGPLGRNLVAPAVTPPATPPPPGAPPGPPPPPTRLEIVGVVDDVRNVPLGQPTEPAIYFPLRQFPFSAMFLAVEGPSVSTAASAIQAALRQAAPGIPLADVRTWAERSRARTAEPRLLMSILVVFGALAALLAALGVYGLFSWTVALRRRELAIRLTLGARPAGVGGLIVRQAALLIGAGLVAGWIVIQAGGQLLTRVLFEVSPTDIGSTAAASLLLVAASLAAALPAAWRAMRVNPVEGLRAE